MLHCEPDGHLAAGLGLLGIGIDEEHREAIGQQLGSKVVAGDVNDALINRQRIAELVAQAQSGALRLEPRDLFVLGRVDTRQAEAMQRAIATYGSVIKDL